MDIAVTGEEQRWVQLYTALAALSSLQAHTCKHTSVKAAFSVVNFYSLNKLCDLGMCFHYQNSVEIGCITASMTSHPESYQRNEESVWHRRLKSPEGSGSSRAACTV